MKELLEKVKKANIAVFHTDKKLDYRIVHQERIERAKEDRWPLN